MLATGKSFLATVAGCEAVGRTRARTRLRERLGMTGDSLALCGLLAAVLLAACSSGGSVDIGHGQSAGATTDFGIAYVKRTLPADATALDALRALDDLRRQRHFWTKADVYIRDKATPSGVERNITGRITGTDFYDIKDLDVSADGNRLIFAMRGPLNPMQKDFAPPTWRIWEYDIAAHSHLVGSPDPTTGAPTEVQFVNARQMEDGRVMALIRPADPGTEFGGNLVILDVVNSVECTQRTLAAGGGSGMGPCPAMSNVTPNDVRTVPGPSPGGRFNSTFPLFDHTNRVLVSWTQCRLLDTTGTIVPCSSANLAVMPALQLAAPLYSIWLFDPANGTLKPVVTPVENDS